MKKSGLLLVILLFGCAAVQDRTQDIPASDDSAIGFIGCSNTGQTVDGYHAEGGTRIWAIDRSLPENQGANPPFGGGTVNKWAQEPQTRNPYWETFDKYLSLNPGTKAVWWQLCIRESDVFTYAHAQTILERLRERIPDVTVYVSPLPPFTDHVCGITGKDGFERMNTLAQQIAEKEEDVFEGPPLPGLVRAENVQDGCHMTPAGSRKVGTALKTFFDDQENVPTIVDAIQTPAEEPLTEEEQAWQKRIDTALERVPCDDKPFDLPNSYYKGKLIDTHYHIPPLDDSSPLDRQDWSSEDLAMPALGRNVRIARIACTFKQERTNGAFAWFAVFPEIIDQSLNVTAGALKNHPNTFVPFIMPPYHDDSPEGSPTVDATMLRDMLDRHPGLFKGYGEIGLYAREDGSAELPPDSPRLLAIYDLLREKGIKLIYLHLGEGQQDELERAADLYPDLTFIFHGDQLVTYRNGNQDLSRIDDILKNHPNVYYGIDELYGDFFLLRPEVSKEEVLAHLAKQNELLPKDLATWKWFIERHPDQVMWGTDRGWSTYWTVDYDIGKAMTSYSRAFIGKLNPDVQERFAYKNAEKLMKLANVTLS